MLRYSFCTTVYNSSETVDRFISALKRSGKPHEIVVVDNYSSDGTYEKLLKYSDVKVIRAKCTRGRGRELSVENSSYDFVVMLDADVEYNDLDMLLDLFEKSDKRNMFWNFLTENSNGATPVAIVDRRILEMMGGYPDLNAAEDTYVRYVAEGLDLFYIPELELHRFVPLTVCGKTSRSDNRYAKSLFTRVKRRLIFTRDTLFVHKLNYSQLLSFYKLSGILGKLICFVEYAGGKALMLLMKVDTVDNRLSLSVKEKGLKF